MKKELKYSGWLKIFSTIGKNKKGQTIVREIMSRSSENRADDCVCGLLCDLDKGKLYFTSQYRPGTTQEDRYLIEAVAGTLEIGEDPMVCFERESMEEIGFQCDEIVDKGLFYLSPGGTTERMYMFIGYGKRVSEGGGLEEENEDIEVIEIDIEDLNDFSLTIKDLKTAYLIERFDQPFL